MAIYGIGLCLSAFFIFFIVSMSFVQGRSLKRRHDHHSHTDYYNSEDSMPRILSRRLEDDLEYRDSYRQMKSHGYPEVFDRSSEENSVEERVPSAHRYKHEYALKNRDFLRRNEESRRHDDDFEASSMRFIARRKRHNRHSPIYDEFTEQEKKDMFKHTQQINGPNQFEFGLHEPYTRYEMEVKDAQNSSICNYTVESIPDTRGSRVPKDLEHIKCNHVGSTCQKGTYCCIQTYRNIEVSYGNSKELMKLYVGCVCALQAFSGSQLTERPLPIND